jgi:hypothetical protein
VAVKAQDITKQSLQVLEALVRFTKFLLVVCTQTITIQPKLVDYLILVVAAVQVVLPHLDQVLAAAVVDQVLW